MLPEDRVFIHIIKFALKASLTCKQTQDDFFLALCLGKPFEVLDSFWERAQGNPVLALLKLLERVGRDILVQALFPHVQEAANRQGSKGVWLCLETSNVRFVGSIWKSRKLNIIEIIKKRRTGRIG